MTDQEAFSNALEIVKTDQRIITGTMELLKQRPELTELSAKQQIVRALEETYGIFYLVTGNEAVISGPYAGLEAAHDASGDRSARVILLLGVGDELASREQVARRLTRQLPDPADAQIEAALLDRLAEAQRLMRERG